MGEAIFNFDKLNIEGRPLTRRQLDCLWLAALGLTAPQTARKLCISEQTVKNHLQDARIKLNAKTTAQAIYLYYCQPEVTSA
jgi:DNA-binding CsgD family transcriptional regulator